MESKPRLKIPLNRIARAGEKDSSIDATAFTKTSRQKDARDREISTLKKVNPCFFWWQSQKHRAICFGVSFQQVYWETRISKILSIHLWIVGPEIVLIWPVVVWSGIAQWRLRVPNIFWKSPILGSSRKHNEPKSTSIMDIGNAAAPWPYRTPRLMSPFPWSPVAKLSDSLCLYFKIRYNIKDYRHLDSRYPTSTYFSGVLTPFIKLICWRV